MTVIADILTPTIQTLDSLLASIAEVKHCLVERNTSALQKAIEQQLQYSEQLAQLDAQRVELLVKSGLENNKAGMTTLLKDLPDAQTQWSEILGKLQQVQKENLVNMRLGDKQTSATQSLLALLSQQLPGASTYDAKGIKPNQITSGSFSFKA